MDDGDELRITRKLWDLVQESNLLKTAIAEDAGLHINTLRRVINEDKGDIKSIVKIACALGYKLELTKI